MRISLLALPMVMLAASAAAAPPPPPPPQIEIPPQLADPATADRLADMMQAMSKAFLNLPVGEIEAAAEGRRPTARDKTTTVGDLARRDDPDFDRDFGRKIADARPMVHQSMKAINDALPAITRSLAEAAAAMQRVADNMPQPYDPKP
jgi:hypothetical protein